MKHYARIFLLSTLTIFSTSLYSKAKTSTENSEKKIKDLPIEQNLKIGNELTAHRYKDLYFSAQPSDNDFKQLKEQGFSAIVNLRLPNEGKYDAASEKKTVEGLGLKYVHIPMDSKDELTDSSISNITSAVVKSMGNGKVLIHCSSGNRVAMWLGGHFHKDHGFSKSQSMEIAKMLGLTKQPAIEKVDKYLKSKK